jgi:uncharacterized protein
MRLTSVLGGFYNLQVVGGLAPSGGGAWCRISKGGALILRSRGMTRTHMVDLGGLLSGGRQVMLVDDRVPIEEFEGIEFPSPAAVHLVVAYADRLLHLEGSIDVEARGECSACLDSVDRRVHVDVDERLDPNTGREDDPFGESNVLAGSRLDVADFAQQLVLSEMPMGLRCQEGCQGLCGICGANKNTGECSCGA